MPKIEIDTCSKTPNYDALEAIAKAMRNNYTLRKIRGYEHESVIKVESGRILKVIEGPSDLHTASPCSCKYRVEKVEK